MGQNTPEEGFESKTEYTFHPDSTIKKFLTELSTPKLIAIINECCGTDYPPDSLVDFGKTEYFSVLGDLDKNSVRGDLVATIQGENLEETTNKIIIELQSTKDDTMGFRMFVYSLNVADEDKKTQTYTFPKGVTIYTTLDKPKEGFDEVHMQIEDFRVGETRYSAKKGDLLTVEFPYINLLAMEFGEFHHSPLEPLQVIYPYRYRKEPKRMKTEENFKTIMETVRDYALEQEGNDKVVVTGLVREIVIDLVDVCENNPELFSEELEMMRTLNKTSTEILIEESEARGEARGKLEGKLETAKGLIGRMATSEISEVTGIPLPQIEALQYSL